MITDYHRPQTLDEALKLLAHADTVPLGGGTMLNRPSEARLAVVDLQALGLDTLHKNGNTLEVGATLTLQQLLESPHLPAALKQAIRLESTLNIRNSATVAGTLVTCDGRSPVAALLLALDSKLTIQPGDESLLAGNLFPLRQEILRGKLITQISFPLNVKLAFEYVSRTPADLPIVAAALAQWTSGRTRLVLGGYGKAPRLAMDGIDSTGLQVAARNAFHEADDEWASAAYRMDMAATLAKRCLESI